MFSRGYMIFSHKHFQYYLICKIERHHMILNTGQLVHHIYKHIKAMFPEHFHPYYRCH